MTTAANLNPALLNPLPVADDSTFDLVTIYDVSRGQLFSIPTGRLGAGGGGGGDANVIGGSAIPTTEGVDGQYYVRTPMMDLYGPKTAGAWGAISGTFKGEDGLGTSQTVAIVAGVLTVDYNAGRYVKVPLGANITSIVITNWPTTGLLGKLTFEFTADGTPRTIAFASVATTKRAQGGAYPVVPSVSGAKLLVHLVSTDALTNGEIYLGGQLAVVA